jgi:hypothetical protein
MEMLWKEAVVAKFNSLSCHLPEEMKESHEETLNILFSDQDLSRRHEF